MADNDFYDSDDDEPPMLVNLEDAEDDAPQLVDLEVTEEESLPPCPVTILSGFLGSGKTTLIQYILQSPDHGKRIAIIENEFGGGDEGLSVESMIARDGANQDNLTDLIELPNGCICCTVKDSLVETLENLIDKRKSLDYILIEASGMANPGPIASLFWLDDALESRLRLDGVVTVVDAYHVQRQLHETEEAAQQIAYADRILLNKVDLIDEVQTESMISSIRAIHPTAPIRPTTFLRYLTWTGYLTPTVTMSIVLRRWTESFLRSRITRRTLLCRSVLFFVYSIALGECTEEAPSHTHTSAVTTVALVASGSVDLSMINRWLASILWPNQDEQDKVLRARLEQEVTSDT